MAEKKEEMEKRDGLENQKVGGGESGLRVSCSAVLTVSKIHDFCGRFGEIGKVSDNVIGTNHVEIMAHLG
jgi:hypothetical protein